MKTPKGIILLVLSIPLFLLPTASDTYAVDPCGPSPEDFVPDQSRDPGSGYSPGGTPPTGVPGPDTSGDFGSGGPGIPNIPDTISYPESWNFQWAPYNPDIVGAPGSASLTVIGGRAPYTWRVSGQGFWFVSDYSDTATTTNSPTATIYADETACGSASITVTDSAGKEVGGSIRSPEGRWVFKGNICGLDGSVTWYDYEGGTSLVFKFEYISANKKQYQESTTNYYDNEECGEVPGICQEWNNTNCPEDYRNNNCIDGDYAGYFPYTCEEGSYHCFCVRKLEYYEWECQ